MTQLGPLQGFPQALGLIRHKSVTSSFPLEIRTSFFAFLKPAEAADRCVWPLRVPESPLDATKIWIQSPLIDLFKGAKTVYLIFYGF